MAETHFRLFVSSPGDVPEERLRVDQVIERLNGEFAGRMMIKPVFWEAAYYTADKTFQDQIPQSADCDLVIAIFKARLGTKLPDNFPKLPSGEPYPSGSAYEVLSAIEKRRSGELPDVYVFRFPEAPAIKLDAQDRREREAQWQQLVAFFDTWFRDSEGRFLAAFQPFTSSDDFARQLEECLRQWLERKGFRLAGPTWDRHLQGSPFPGLAAFEENRASVFFGRDLAKAQALARLREAGAGGDHRLPFLLLIGSSGSGKSSLLRAAMLPQMIVPGIIPEVDLWRPALMSAGAEPFQALAQALQTEAALGAYLGQIGFGDGLVLARQLAGDVTIALAPLRQALHMAATQRQAQMNFAAPRPARLALALDQAERLFSEATPDVAAGFAALLQGMVQGGLAYVVMALRSDAYASFQAIPALLALREAGASFDLVPPHASELEEIVTRPVAACEPPLRYEGGVQGSLAARLVADAKGGDALPLLQMTLARLDSAAAARGDGVLRHDDYHGMDEAVTQTANEAMANLAPEARAQLFALVSGLVSDTMNDPVTGAQRPIITPLARQMFEASQPARTALVEAFVQSRLLTAESDGAVAQVRPVHEALLRIWPQAADILRQAAPLIRTRHTLEPLVEAWSQASPRDKTRHLMISTALLGGAQQMVARFGSDVPAAMQAFVKAAAREAQKRTRFLRLLTTAAVVAAIGMGGVGWVAWQQRNAALAANKQTQIALTAATQTANSVVFTLAQKFRDVKGVSVNVIGAILDPALKMLDQLVKSGLSSAGMLNSQAAALSEAAITLLAQGDTKGAQQDAGKSLEIVRQLARSQPHNTDFQRELSEKLIRLGDVQYAEGDVPGARASYQASVANAAKLVAAHPGNTDLQRDLAWADEKMGSLRQSQGDVPGALAAFNASLVMMQKLAKEQPGNVVFQRDLAWAYEKLGYVLKSNGDLPKALAVFQDARTIKAQLAKSDSSNTGLQRDLSVSDINIADIALATGHLSQALTNYDASHAIMETLTKSDPENTIWRRDIAVSDERMGDIWSEQHNMPKALAAYQAERDIFDMLSKKDPGNSGWQRDLSVADYRVGNALQKLAHPEQARAAFEAGLAIDLATFARDATPQAKNNVAAYATALGHLAYHFLLVGNFQDALAVSNEAIAVAPQKLWLLTIQADALMMLRRTAEARTIYLAHRGEKTLSDGTLWEKSVLGGFADLRKAGFSDPLMAEITQDFATPSAQH